MPFICDLAASAKPIGLVSSAHALAWGSITPKCVLSLYKICAGLCRLVQTNHLGILLGLGGGIKFNNNARNQQKKTSGRLPSGTQNGRK